MKEQRNTAPGTGKIFSIASAILTITAALVITVLHWTEVFELTATEHQSLVLVLLNLIIISITVERWVFNEAMMKRLDNIHRRIETKTKEESQG